MTFNTIIKGNTEFAIDMYHELLKLSDTNQNLFYSPYSISTSLAMVYGGAKGETSQQMAKTLHLPTSDNLSMNGEFSKEDFHRQYGLLIEQMKKQEEKNQKYQLSIANALWLQKDYLFLDSFLDLNIQFYNAGLDNVDYIDEDERENIRQKINQWTEDRTNNKIKDLIPKDFLNKLSRLVVTNAVYFKSKWMYQFTPQLTQIDHFFVSKDKIVETPLMNQIKDFKYAEDETCQVIELAYEGYDLGMLIFLPKEKGKLHELEKTLSVKTLSHWQRQMRRTYVEVYLPKFKMELSLELNTLLQRLGMLDAFVYPDADFSGIDGTHLLYISSILHKTFIEVNEKETEAAAATGFAFRVGAAMPEEKPKVFRADHPFIFSIQDIKSKSILFMGRVVNPTI